MTRMAMAYSPGGALVVALYTLPIVGLYLNSPTILWPYYSRRRVLNILYIELNFAILPTSKFGWRGSLKFTGMLLSLSKIRDRDWSYTRHVIWINNQCCPNASTSRGNIHAMLPGATVPGNVTGEHDQPDVIPADFWSERYIKQINYIFCAAFVDFASVDMTSLSFRH